MDEQTDNNQKAGSGSVASWSWKRTLPLFVLLLGTVLFFVFDLNAYFSFDALRIHNDMLLAFVHDHIVFALLMYFVMYIVVVACSLPGGLVMTVLGGYLFGLVVGGISTVIGATIGATLIFLAAKTALGDPLRAKAGPAMAKMEAGIKKDAFNYLLVLRLIPLFPFFLVNLAPAFLGVGLRTFTIATFIGIIPGTFVFTSVGSGLNVLLESGQEPSAKLLLEPAILLPLIGLAILALVPVIYRHYQARKANDG
jgi:uncharacterized membrane protein YdjX (TVP38/TMEM64 family)